MKKRYPVIILLCLIIFLGVFTYNNFNKTELVETKYPDYYNLSEFLPQKLLYNSYETFVINIEKVKPSQFAKQLDYLDFKTQLKRIDFKQENIGMYDSYIDIEEFKFNKSDCKTIDYYIKEDFLSTLIFSLSSTTYNLNNEKKMIYYENLYTDKLIPSIIYSFKTKEDTNFNVLLCLTNQETWEIVDYGQLIN